MTNWQRTVKSRRQMDKSTMDSSSLGQTYPTDSHCEDGFTGTTGTDANRRAERIDLSASMAGPREHRAGPPRQHVPCQGRGNSHAIRHRLFSLSE